MEQEPEGLQLMIPTEDDFRQIVEIDHLLFPGETWMQPEELQRRLPYNPEVTHVLRDMKTNTVLGYISMSPLKHDVLERLIRLEIDETSIKPEDFTAYIPNIPLDCYVVSVAARPGPGIAQHYYAGKLIVAYNSYLMELLERGIILKRIYTVATTEEGDKIARGLHFTPLVAETEWNGDYEDFRRPYVLDLEEKDSKSNFVNAYQKRRKNQNRRTKRYIKQSERR